MSEHAHTLWDQVLQVMQGEVSKPSYETWFRNTEGITINDNTIVVKTPHDIGRKFLSDNYREPILRTLRAITGMDMDVSYVSGDPSPNEELISNEQVHLGTLLGDEVYVTRLNPKYTFETFVVGNSNMFAHAACLAVAESPGKAYNPLFIYGGVGLGKTHLMQAIGHFVLEHSPATKVVYAPCEKFTNDLIDSIRDDKTMEFRERYRNVDVLLIDDVQFLAQKERTQEEFFHTFNTLHEAGKQIVISSDRPPKEIPTLEDRLRSRFEWGLISDIQPPDLETRIAILNKKAQQEGLDIPQDVMAYIANQIRSNIRELEGALTRVAAHCSIHNRLMTVSAAADCLKDLIPSQRPRQVSIYQVQQAVAQYFRVSIDDFKSKKRTRNITYPRQIAMYLSRELTEASLPRIGDEFGGRDHTTVMHACSKIQEDIQQDQVLAASIKDIIAKLKEMT
ncbi:MAG: chromosomal replication initiator protein DnaA [Firmicutes bacterium]|nr:chromosomal replication initiator protein DnaA [Bacillota bacterium]HXL04506.1 chromosomal replication initiator protein DnaA [Bacillota bacterium]